MVRSIALNGRPSLFSSALLSWGGVLSRTTPWMIPIGFHSFTYWRRAFRKCVFFSCPQVILSPQIGPLVHHMHRFRLSGPFPPHHVTKMFENLNSSYFVIIINHYGSEICYLKNSLYNFFFSHMKIVFIELNFIEISQGYKYSRASVMQWLVHSWLLKNL